MRIGDICVPNGAALAPMAGITDTAMRCLCAEFGASFTVSEMVSAKALSMGDAKSRTLLRGGGGEGVYGVQLFGSEPQAFYEAVRSISGEQYDFLDINMGCPAPKIVGGGAGSALLKDPPLAAEIAKVAVSVSEKPVSVKLRIGWDEDTMTGKEVAKRCEDAGVCMLMVHARTRKQQYAPGVNLQAVADIKGVVGIPVIYNGDIQSAEDALNALQITGCDGVAVGRAAVGNPFLFAQIAAVMSGQQMPPAVSLRLRLEVMERQLRGMCEEKGEERAMREARKVAAGYMRGLRGAAALRSTAHGLTYYEDVARLCELAYEYNG